jgi:hypothetical protein
VTVMPNEAGVPDYLVCGVCREYWRVRGPVLGPVVERTAAVRRVDPDGLLHGFRLDVHARHLRGLVVLEVCCGLHTPGDVGACCDPDDCGPCCPRCPTCPTLRRRGGGRLQSGRRR